jgi:hypothetical protein
MIEQHRRRPQVAAYPSAAAEYLEPHLICSGR